MSLDVRRHNPAELPRNPAFSQAVSVSGAARTIYVGAQNAVTASGSVTGTAVAVVAAEPG